MDIDALAGLLRRRRDGCLFRCSGRTGAIAPWSLEQADHAVSRDRQYLLYRHRRTGQERYR